MIPQDMTPAEMAPEDGFSASDIAADLVASLFQHPEIAERVVQTWGDPLCRNFMYESLLPDTYEEKYTFTDSEAGALMGLIELHDKLHPRKSDVWGIAA